MVGAAVMSMISDDPKETAVSQYSTQTRSETRDSARNEQKELRFNVCNKSGEQVRIAIAVREAPKIRLRSQGGGSWSMMTAVTCPALHSAILTTNTSTITQKPAVGHIGMAMPQPNFAFRTAALNAWRQMATRAPATRILLHSAK